MSQQEPAERGEATSIPHWYDPSGDQLTVTGGSGIRVEDDTGNEYLDFSSQLYCCNLGHDNEAVIEAMTEQAHEIPYVSSAKRTPSREELTEELAAISPGDLSHTFLSVTGSEANEVATQLAREYQDAPTVLTRWRSYHGGTYGAGSLTGDPSTRGTLDRHAGMTGAGKFLPPIPRAFDTDDPDELAERAAAHLEFVIRNEDPDTIAAILTEPVAGTSGGFPAPPGYFERVREICDKYDILLIADEVISGFGRCGDWFGMSTENVTPDMMTFAKGVTAAYAPLAGVMTDPDMAAFVEEDGFGLGQTFGGHPVSCAAGVAAIDAYRDGPIENVRELEPVLQEELEDLEANHDAVYDVRGRGFLWGVEFADPATGEPFYDPRVDDGYNPVSDVLELAQEDGVLFGGGRPSFQIMVTPPLITGRDDLETAIDVLDEAIEDVFN